MFEYICIVALYWLLISVISVFFIVRLFKHCESPFDCFEDHAENMDDEGGWK